MGKGCFGGLVFPPENCNIYKQGKNWYCEVDNIKITCY